MGALVVAGGLFMVLSSGPSSPQTANASPTASATPTRSNRPRPRTSRRPKRSPRPRPSPSAKPKPKSLYRQLLLSYHPLDAGLKRTFTVVRRTGGEVSEGRELWVNQGEAEFEGETYVKVQVSQEGSPDAPSVAHYRYGTRGVYRYDADVPREVHLLPSPLEIGQTWKARGEERTATRLQTLEWHNQRLRDVLVIRVVRDEGASTEVQYWAPELGLVRVRLVHANGDRVDKDLVEDTPPSDPGTDPTDPETDPLDEPNPLEPDPVVAPAAGATLSASDVAAYFLTPVGTRLTYALQGGGTSTQTNMGVKKLGGQTYQSLAIQTVIPGETKNTKKYLSACRDGVVTYNELTRKEELDFPAPLSLNQKWVHIIGGKLFTFVYEGRITHTVKAGTFHEVLLVTATSGAIPDFKQEFYYARGVGLLDSSNLMQGRSVSQVELTKLNAGTGSTLKPNLKRPLSPGSPDNAEAAGGAGGPSGADELEELDAGWWLYTARDGSCTLELPGKPAFKTASLAAVVRGSQGRTATATAKGGGKWALSHYTLPPNTRFSRPVDRVLQDISGGIVRGLSANRVTEVEERLIRLKGLRGRETLATVIYPQARFSLLLRVYMSKGHIYQLLVIEQAPARGIKKLGRRFFKSFKPVESAKKKKKKKKKKKRR